MAEIKPPSKQERLVSFFSNLTRGLRVSRALGRTRQPQQPFCIPAELGRGSSTPADSSPSYASRTRVGDAMTASISERSSRSRTPLFGEVRASRVESRLLCADNAIATGFGFRRNNITRGCIEKTHLPSTDFLLVAAREASTLPCRARPLSTGSWPGPFRDPWPLGPRTDRPATSFRPSAA